MEFIQSVIPKTLLVWAPSTLTFFLGIITLFLFRFMLSRPTFLLKGRIRPVVQVLGFFALLILLVAVILLMPIGETNRGQILSLLGILVTGAIALSSTTFVGNTMAGFMIRAVNHFRPGDFLRVQEFFGRVTELGLLHTEIQTEDRDLLTLPNLFLITNPVKVVHESGTIVSAEVSLGYDVGWKNVESYLLRAAENVGLKGPFVRITQLGDFSINYKISGFLSDVKYLITVHSKLRSSMIDELHRNGVEIVSPTFMNQRVFQTSESFIPATPRNRAIRHNEDPELPESIIFDKAERADELSKLEARIEQLAKLLDEVTKELDSEKQETVLQRLKFEKDVLEQEQTRLIERKRGLEENKPE